MRFDIQKVKGQLHFDIIISWKFFFFFFCLAIIHTTAQKQEGDTKLVTLILAYHTEVAVII